MQPTAEDLGALALFATLDVGDRERLAAIAGVLDLPQDTTLFTEGEPSRDLYVVAGGRITLCTSVPGRPETCFLSLRHGELLGWSALLGRPWTATAHVVEPSRVVRFGASELLELCEMDHDIGYTIMRRAFEEIADRLHFTRLQMLDVFGVTR